MTYQQELTSLESMYSAWLAAGLPQSYTVDGRMVTRAQFEAIAKRIDQLRLAVSRQSGGGTYVAQFRNPE